MIAYMYPRELQVLAGRGYAGCLDGCFQGYQGEVMQDLASELPRIPIPRNPVNKSFLIFLLALPQRIRAQPQRDVRRLYRLPHNAH
jgi:hypothetical protein